MAIHTSRAKRLIKMLERVLKKDHLYNDEELKLILFRLYREYVKKHLSKILIALFL